MSAASKDVHGRLADIERNGAELLDGVDHKPDTTFVTQATEGGEVETIAVRPLNRTDGDHSCAGRDSIGEIFHQHFAVAIGDDIDFDALFLLLNPGNGNLEKFKV